MFDWLKKKKQDPIWSVPVPTEETEMFQEPDPTPPMPKVEAPKKDREYYRVGRTESGQTTLTVIADYGNSMTLTMNRAACDQMIRMLQSTYDTDESTTGEEE